MSSMPKEFEYYVKKGIIRKCSPDKQRAEFLIIESNDSYEGLCERVEKLGINEKNANSIIKDCYDVLMELIRAKMLLSGYNSAGRFAHEAEVAFLVNLNFSEHDIIFLNDLRYFRNSVTYYGKKLDLEYANKVVEFTKVMHPKLNKIMKKEKKNNNNNNNNN
jgi:hypothetical protein